MQDQPLHTKNQQDLSRVSCETPSPRCAISSSDLSHLSTPSSNTVPSKYIIDPHVLRSGIDSLYLSYQGELTQASEIKLSELKALAQDEDATLQAKAQLPIGDHLFEVLDKGQKPFAFVLVDNWFRISFSRRSSKAMPLAYIQISSELLTFTPLADITRDLEFIINTLAVKVSTARVSRVDLFADFTTAQNLDDIPLNHWGTRTTLFDKHYIRPDFTGWSIGYKGDISARLYDKTLELIKSKKDYLKPIWAISGWNSEQSVWRLEFQYKREILNELQSIELDAMIVNQGALWRFACNDWLRLCIPNAKDTNKSRWPTHPLWSSLSQIDWDDTPTQALQRVRKERIPSDNSLFIQGIAGLTSFMALNNITDLYDGYKAYMQQAKVFHDSRGRFTDETFLGYVRKKVSEKGRHYNSISNQAKPDKAILKQSAKHYKTEKGGE